MTSNQNRRLAVGLSVLVVVIGAATVEAQRQRRIPRFNEEVLVKPGAAMVLRGLGPNDHLMGFSGPIGLPGVTLSAGAYVFRTGPSRTVQVLSADRSIAYAWLLTTPVNRQEVSLNAYAVWFDEPVAGSARRITAWFLPGQNVGHEFSYPQQHAQDFKPTAPIATGTK